MIEILYHIGWLASLLFFLRFNIQWLQSEKQKKSHVTPIFWHLSLAAHGIMVLQGFIQSQYPILIIQASNAIIAFRNLELMKKKKRSFAHCFIFLIVVLSLLTLLFLIKSFITGQFYWMRSPYSHDELPFLWHAFGLFGMLLFASRFWIQWIQAEKEKTSSLNPSFWWISLVGAISSLIYFIRLLDTIQIISYAIGIIPYMRNIILLKTTLRELTPNLYYFVAGEKSGDVLGSELLEELKKEAPHLKFKGVGGSAMREQGLECIMPTEKLNVMGFSDVLKAFPRIIKALLFVQKKIMMDAPEKVILIDYPDFNMILAKRLRKKGYQGKIIHYVCPSVWAWRKGRIQQLSKTHDHILSIFPFEKRYFASTTLNVTFVGHPLAKIATPSDSETSFETLSLFPGSRPHAVERNLPIQLEVATLWLKEHPTFKLAISYANDELKSIIFKELVKRNLTADLVSFNERYNLMKRSTLAMATSGTVTLELALFKVPTLITYLLSPLNYFLGRYIFRIKIPYICIVNILAHQELFPEFLGKTLSSSSLYKFLTYLYHNKKTHKLELSKIEKSLRSENKPSHILLN